MCFIFNVDVFVISKFLFFFFMVFKIVFWIYKYIRMVLYWIWYCVWVDFDFLYVYFLEGIVKVVLV